MRSRESCGKQRDGKRKRGPPIPTTWGGVLHEHGAGRQGSLESGMLVRVLQARGRRETRPGVGDQYSWREVCSHCGDLVLWALLDV